MKTILHIRFDASQIPGGADTILQAARCGSDVATVSDAPILDQMVVWLTLEEVDPRVAEIFRLLRAHGYPRPPFFVREDDYTEDELQSAPLLIMMREHERRVFGGMGIRETTYDLADACPICGTGARQISPLYIEAKEVKKIKALATAGTTYQDIFVRDKLVKRLQAAGVTGFSLRDVIALKKDGETIELERKQIVPEHVMPPTHPSSLLDYSKMCAVCHRGGIEANDDYPLRLAYRAKDLVNLPDFNVTWEWFGEARFNSTICNLRFSRAYTLVTPKVMNLLRPKDGPDAFHWIPIRVVED